MAAAALDVLAANGYPIPRRIEPPTSVRGYSRLAEFRWFARHGAPYLARKAAEGHLGDWTNERQPV
jgi:hypothetical protein